MDGRGWNTGSQPPVQHNIPADSPFEEPEQAPELRENRSDNLYSRDEPFWNRVVDAPKTGHDVPRDANYWNHPDVMDTDRILHVDSDTKLQKLQKFLGSGATKRFLAVMAVLVVLAVILYSTLFQVRAITVVGNDTITEQEIIRLSGLHLGQNSMSIDDETVMRKVEGNRYLRCTLVDVQWDRVTIHVKERVPAVHINRNGLVVVMDNRGFVLEETLQAGTKYDHLVKVIGLDVRRCALGQQIALQSQIQLDAYTQILVELKAMKGLYLLRELDMTSMDSIYLATSEQPFSSQDTEAEIAKRKIFYVRLGSEDSIHEKLRAFMITRDKLLEMGYEAGTIDVTDPGRPTFSP
ncbi:MAG: FtsQ-type POTRA domain-containing protein [Clostridiales bacterium]|nr:FtsQ-type POTRA domain-containing protein [Clostridiales bacterium]